MDTNCCKVDAFAVLFDVSHVNGRSLIYQSSEVFQVSKFSQWFRAYILAVDCDIKIQKARLFNSIEM